MEWKRVAIDSLEYLTETVERSLEGLTIDDLNRQPKPDCNSMGWLAWHLSRAQDRMVSALMGSKQVWVEDMWYTKFNRPGGAEDWGFGHAAKDLAEFKSPDAQTLLGYNKAVLERCRQYISGLSEADLDGPVNHPRFKTVEAQVVALIGNLQHAGQLAYVRGFLKGIGWAK